MDITFSGGEIQFKRKIQQMEWEAVEASIRKAIQMLLTQNAQTEIFLGNSVPRPGTTSGNIDGIPWSVSEKQPADQIRIVQHHAGDEKVEEVTFPWGPIAPSYEESIRSAANSLSESLRGLPGSPSVRVSVDVSLD